MEYWTNTFLVPSASPSSAPTMTFCVVSSCWLRALIGIGTFAMAFSFRRINWAPTTLWFNMWQWRSRLQNWPKILVFIVLILVFRIPVAICTLWIILLLRMWWRILHFCRSLKLVREILVHLWRSSLYLWLRIKVICFFVFIFRRSIWFQWGIFWVIDVGYCCICWRYAILLPRLQC